MDLLFCLEGILSDFRHLFNQQNFAVFQAFIFGFIANSGRGTLMDLYQCSGSDCAAEFCCSKSYKVDIHNT